MKNETRGNKRSDSKWLRRAGIALAIVLLAPTLLFTIGWFNRDLLIDELQEWYNDNNNGTLEIGEVNTTFLKGFPNVSFSIKDIYQTSFDTILDKRSSIFIKEAQVSIAATDLLSGDLQFKNIDIYKAEIYSEVISERSVDEYIGLKKQKQAHPNNGIELPGWVDPKRTNFSLREISFISKDSMLNKYFNLEVQQAMGKIRSNNEKIIGSLDFNILVKALGFNTRKGSFINGSLVSGNPKFVLNGEKTMLTIPKFLLEIGSQTFTTKADLNFKGINAYSFSLHNPETDFQELRGLLPDSISAKLLTYEILEPLETKLSLSGEFQYGDIPYIDADFSSLNNKLKIGDSLQLSGFNFNGYLTNTLKKGDSLDKQEPARQDIKIFFEDISANVEDINISAFDSYFQSSEEALNFVNANLNMSGSNESLTRLMQTENFDFLGGNFVLNTHIEGDIPDLAEVFNYATGNFTLKNTRVVLRKNNLQLPVEIIDLQLNNKNSVLEQLKISLPNGEQLVFKGTIDNAASLLGSDPVIPASADVRLDSEKLNINDLIATAMEFIPPSEKSANNLNTLHDSFEALYKKFQPRFKLDLKTVEYNENQFNDLLADIRLLNAETIHLNNLSFNFNDAFTKLQGNLKIPEPNNAVREPVFLNVEARSSGPVKVFQELFNIQLLDIKTGDFSFLGNVTGNIQEFEQLLNNANGDLKLTNTKFYYPKADMDIQLDSLSVAVHDSNIRLKNFVVEIDEHHPFALQGYVEEFPEFLLDSVPGKGKIFVALDAAYVDMDEWLHTLHSIEPDTLNKPLKNRDLAAIFADIYHFDPEFKIAVDSIKYKDLVSRELDAKVYFENDSILKLDDLSIRYQDSEALIRGELAAHKLHDPEADENPFSFEFSAEAKGKSKDLNELLQTVNFTLRSGDFKFNGSYQGEAKDLNILNSNARGDLILGTTLVDIEGTDIQIPVDSLHLEIKNNLASLEKLDVNLPGKSAIDITGEIDNFSNFINNDQAVDSHRSSFIIKSPYLDSWDIKKFLGITTKKIDTSKKQEFKVQDLKDLLSNINNSYFPSASIEIDSLIYNDLEVSDFTSGIGFNNAGAIRISDTELQYSGGSIALMIEAGVGDPEDLPVKIAMKIENIDLGKLVKDLDYFNYIELRKAKKISGNLDLKLDLSGKFNGQDSLEMNSLNGTLDLDLTSLALYEFDPIIESVVLLKEERFEKLQFRPIRQTIKVTNGNINIPRTQIQSSALHFFVEGESKIGEYYNIWISLPWNNILKSRDGTKLPEKISFDESGVKFYLQIIQDKESEKAGKHKLKTKFRLGNRKLEKSKEN
ncbi:AsmA-like C-terminal region [Salegentibacter holothuriorum]|uniref:AsmA-like C-terminal region n=1 Tax=Salegentibacter holothuriorum TaxID=241145 RepID=A0A1T5D5Y1_9FLAO|nr:AsmA-like C-terminal region-containing protein [Salegentibacter holothuriorum]SKB67114.1 AsmA-like C-terminal region [Salegentibacter holothuriorum]